MTLQALIVDDEPLAQRYLAELLSATGQVAVAAVVGTIEQAEVALRELAIDVAFVDIRLVDRSGDVTGLRWARELVARPRPPALVMATAIADHALDAFETGAVDYLLKPFTTRRVASCVERLVARRAAEPSTVPTRLLARSASALIFLEIEGILAFEAEDRLTYLHHTVGSYLVDISLNALEGQFAGRMIRAHRNWLVSIARVRELARGDGEPMLLVGASLEVPVARDRAAAVRDALVRDVVGQRRP